MIDRYVCSPPRLARILATTLLLGLVCFAPTVRATTVNGAASVWGYVRDDTLHHTQLVPMLTLNVRDFGIRDVRFETTLRAYSDLQHDKAQDRRLSIWRGALIWTPQQSPWEVRLGQQWLTEGVGRGNVAGVWARRKIDKVSDVSAYAGARLGNAISVQDKYQDQGMAAGIHGRTHWGRAAIGASYFYIGKNNKLLFHAAGVEASGRIVRHVTARGRFDINLARGSVERAQLLADWMVSPKVTVTGEVRSQQPRVFEDSYFRRFLSEANTTYARLGAMWTFYKMYYVRGQGVTLFTETSNTLYKAQAAVGCRYGEAGYTHWLSVDKAEMDGFFAQARYPFRGMCNAFAGIDFARGSNTETDLRPDEDSQAIYFGVSASPVDALTLYARAEQVKAPQIKSEWRGLFSVIVRFTNQK
jgi:hypothetical protein